MNAPVSLSSDEVRALRLRAQHLVDRPAAGSLDAARLVREVCGVQAQDAFAADLSIWARASGLKRSDVNRARVTERSIVRTWCMRGTLHLVAAEDLGWLLPLLGPHFIRLSQSRYAQLGLTDDVWTRASAAMREIFRAHGPVTRAEFAKELSQRELPAEGQIVPHLLRRAALEGFVCCGPERGGKPTYALLSDWLGTGRTLEPGAALITLANRYLAAFGPATAEDFSAWSGLKLSEARAGFDAILDQLVQVEANGQTLWMPENRGRWLDDLGEKASGVRLLPAFDTYLLGYLGRELTVPERFSNSVHPGGGIIRPSLLVNGIAAGIWRRNRAKGALTITLEPFEPLDEPTEGAIEAEVADMSRFLGLNTRLVIQSSSV